MKRKYLNTKMYFVNLEQAKAVADAFSSKGWDYYMYYDGDRRRIVMENRWYYYTKVEKVLAGWLFKTAITVGNKKELKKHPERCLA